MGKNQFSLVARLVVGLCCLWGYSVQAQSCNLSLHGEVLTASLGEPLPYAKVHLKGQDLGVWTDSMGRFELHNLCPGQYTLVCEHLHCEHQELTYHLEDRPRSVTIVLEDEALKLEEVLILSQQRKEEDVQSGVTLSGLALSSKQGQSLADILTSAPGISVKRTGATIAKPVIHGLHSNRILILNNGIRLEGQQWGSDHAPEIDPFLAQQVRVLRGASAVQYGSGALAGVILVEPKSLPDSVGIGGEVNFQAFSNGRVGVASGQLEGKLASIPLSWRMQGTLKRGGNLHTPDYYLTNTGVAEQNFSAAAKLGEFKRGLEVFYSQFNTRIGIMSASHLGGRSDLERAFQAPQPLGSDTARFSYHIQRPFQLVNHHLTKVRGYRRLGTWGKVQAIYAYQFNKRQEYDLHKPRGSVDGVSVPELDFRIHTHTFETILDHNAWRGISGRIGAFGLYQNNALQGRPFIPNFVMTGGELYAIERWKGRRIELEAGLRYDYRYLHSARREAADVIFEIRTFQNVSGSVGLIWRVAPEWTLRFNSGSAWRPPHVNELFSDGLHHGAATVEIGNPDLAPEQAIKSVASLEYRGLGGFSATLSGYYHYFFNFIYRRPGGLDRTIRGTFPKLVYDQAAVRLAGLDIELAYRPVSGSGLQASLKGSYLRADNLDTEQPLIFMPANWGEAGLGYQTKNWLGLNYAWVQVSSRHVTEQTRIPLTENPEEADWLPPPGAYTLVNLDLGLRTKLYGQTIELGLRADNLLNQRYRDYLNRFRYFADEIGRNVSLRVKATF